MSHSDVRKFSIVDGKRERTPMILSLGGPSGSGKTYSACRLAVGAQQITGGRIGLVDTEAKRALHYIERFKDSEGRPIRYIDFAPPFGPLDYMAAIEQLIADGCMVIIVDSMTHEHSGDGGVMEQIESWLDEKCGDDWKKREAMNQVAHARIKPQRKKLNNRIVQLGRGGVLIILCYRADDGYKPAKKPDGKTEIRATGLKAETTSKLVYDVTQGFMLRHGSDGVPDLKATTPEEGVVAKNPIQFRGWFKEGEPLSEEHGRKLAEWAAGGASALDGAVTPASKSAQRQTPPSAGNGARGRKLQSLAELRQKLNWTTEQAAKWRGDVFGEPDPTKMSENQLDDTISLMRIWAEQGEDAYLGELSVMAGLGRARAELVA